MSLKSSLPYSVSLIFSLCTLIGCNNSSVGDSAESNTVKAMLAGPGVLYFSEPKLPFLYSDFAINQGSKSASGGCTFPTDSTAFRPESLGPNQRLITVQRAVDTQACVEVLEQGVIDTVLNPEARKLIDPPSDSSTKTTTTILNSDGTSSAPSSKRGGPGAKLRVWFTDKKNPLIVTANQFGMETDGFVISGITLEANYSPPPNCQSTGGLYAEFTEEIGTLGWYREIQTKYSTSHGCTGASIKATATHANKSNYGVFDCSNIFRISYAPLELVMPPSSPNTQGGSVTIDGDFDKCGEYAQRWTDGPY